MTLPTTCERCRQRPVRVTHENDGFSIAMLPTGHLVCGECVTQTSTPTQESGDKG